VPGTSISVVEVTGVSPLGFGLLVGDEELFVSFADFPWFGEVPHERLRNVTRPQPNHLYWPDLDIDVAVDSIRHPERYPLVSRHRA